MRPEAQPWLRQAEADLQAARDSLASAHYEWACFQAQQSAEKALKAFLYERGYNTRLISLMRHSLHGPGSALEACEQLEPEFSSLNLEADLLNQYSIAPRYPDSHTLAGKTAPADFFKKEDAERCISAAESILSTVRRFVTS
jgi:HEPN domain-containing protein